MEHRTEFDLKLAIGQYVEEIDCHHLLSREEREELFDHLLSGTDELMQDGLSEREAFRQCKERFGEASLISSEYATARPFGAAMVAAIGGLLLFFTVPILNALLMSLSAFSYWSGNTLGLVPKWIQAGDVALKFLVLGGIASYLVYRVKNRPYFRKIELWSIPILGYLLPMGSGQVLHMFYDRSNAYRFQIELMNKLFLWSSFLPYLMALIAVGIFYVVRFRSSRKASYSTRQNGIPGSLLTFFYLLLAIGSIGILSPVALYTGHWLGLSTAWVKVSDIVLKVTMMTGSLVYIVYRLKKQPLIGSIESVVLPVLALVCPIIADWAFWWFVDPSVIDVRLINHTILNSVRMHMIALPVLIVVSYVLIAREQKRLVAG